jgi:hypothetical protein
VAIGDLTRLFAVADNLSTRSDLALSVERAGKTMTLNFRMKGSNPPRTASP